MTTFIITALCTAGGTLSAVILTTTTLIFYRKDR